MRRISLFILTLILLLTSLPTGYAIQKGDDKGEVLNLPPFVDFEVKEKRKVDVIVDVGNTTMGMDELSSLVNLHLRPKLQAEGLDYQIHVEKSNEGSTKLYFVTPQSGTSPGKVKEYDVSTRETKELADFFQQQGNNKVVRSVNNYNVNGYDQNIYDPINNSLVYKSVGGMYYKDLNSNYALDGEVKLFSAPNDFGTTAVTGRVIQISPSTYYAISGRGYKKIDIDRNGNGDIVLNQTHYQSGGLYNFDDGSFRSGALWVPLFPDKLYMWVSNTGVEPYQIQEMTINNNGTLVTNESGSTIIRKDITKLHEYANHSEYDFRIQNSNIVVLPGRGTIVYGIQKNKKYVEGVEDVSGNKIESLVEYDPKTGETRILLNETKYEHIDGTKEGFTSLSDDRLVYRWCTQDTSFAPGQGMDKECELRIMDDLDKPSEYRTLYRYDIPKSERLDYEKIADKQPLIIGTIGNKVVYTLGYKSEQYVEKKLMIIDVDTEEITEIDRLSSDTYALLSHFTMFQYPDWYVSEKRYMSDILDEGLNRSDSELYYVRIDDYKLSQLSMSKELATLSTKMLAKNTTYLALGNQNNVDQHESFLNTIDNRGRFISNTNMETALEEAAGMITNKMEADLHVLVANESMSLATIKDGLKQVQKELQAGNIVSSIHYIQGTSASKAFDLVSQINWRNDRNNYVVMFNRGSMSELNNVEYEVEVATELSGQYASYISIGTEANKAANDRLIATNKSGGVFTSSTTMSAIKTVISKHVKDTAVKNPKRVTDTLVLNYDQETGEYSSDLIINTFYEDFENDPKYNERFKTTHDPTVYENHTGVMEGIGQYQPSPTTKFTKVGKYEMVVQVQDNPSTNAAFSNYREWSLDSLSRLVLFVHRAPVADFTAVVNTSRRLTIVDLSYDIDRYSERNKGIVTATWKWKKVDDADWTSGSPPTTLAANTDYLISLKVKDRDGAWSNEVIKLVTTKDSNQPPVALFTVSPKTSSWSKTFTITDQSYDPDGDSITKREWLVYKDGKQLLTKGSTPTATELKNAAVSAGLSQLGSYQIRLRVQDSLGIWSEWYQDYAYVVNHAPIAEFEPLTTTYRDTVNTVLNLTENPDIDGDAVTYRWRLMKGDKTYSLGTTKDVSFRIRDRGLGKDAVGTWSLELRAADPLGAESYVTHSFQVLNQIPTAEITNYPIYGYIDEPYNFAANSDDPDTEDKSSLQYFWKLTTPSKKVITYYNKNLSNMMFKEKGEYTMEHWVMDQLGAESEVDKVEFTILNKLPIADFTRTPITTYRGVDIDFKSLGTDLDGWREGYRYELLRDGQSPLTLSTDADFTRSFSSVGTYDIRHTVTDNDGASDSITKQIYIVNRAPRAEVVDPSGTTTATATEFNTLTPIIRWTMTDADNDPQVQYQLQLKNQAGAVLRTTSATTTANKTFTIPNGWLTEGPTYRVSVRVYDGYDWSEYSADKYFYIMLNRPPTPGFTFTPAIIYEGDTLMIKHAVDDLDLDTLSIRYTVTAPNGQKSYYPSATGYYNVSSRQYSNDAFSIPSVLPGNYIIEQSVTDSKSESVKLSRTIRVAPLGIVGQVAHTERWEEYRNAYNESLPAGNAKEWLPLQFYSGERFMLSADTTLADHAEIGSMTYAVKVTALLQTTGTKVELSYEKDRRWSGSMWDESFGSLTRGKHTFTFNVQYSNGVIKQHDVEIEIIGKASDLVGVHRWK